MEQRTTVTLSSPDGHSVSTTDEAVVQLVRGLMETEVGLVVGHDEYRQRRVAFAQRRAETGAAV